MHRWSVIPPLALLAGLACVALAQGCAAPSPLRDTASAPGGSASPAPCGSVSSPAIALCPDIPADVSTGPNDNTLALLQPDFDIFSWNSFIALIWPPGLDGSGDPTQQPGAGPSGDNPTVWELWRNVSTIFLPDGQTPPAVSVPQIPAACLQLAQPGVKVLTQIGKVPALLSETVEPFDTGPLIDQNGAYARFEIVVNPIMYQYISDNGLYSKSGQQAFKRTVQFPCGKNGSSGENGSSEVGAMMVKAAWKVMGADDDLTRFHTAPALVYTPPSTSPPVTESCTLQTVGLVGLHIAHKVNSAPQWVWSTFEQVDNVPDLSQLGQGLAAHYNFFSPSCTNCPQNEPPPRPWVPNMPGMPSQIVRLPMVPDFALASAQARNAEAKALLTGVNPNSVWQFYELVSTQWPTDGQQPNCAPAPANPGGDPFPQFLANTTLETYIQGTTPNVSSSCIGCHGNAAMTTGAPSDFTYTLQLAQ